MRCPTCDAELFALPISLGDEHAVFTMCDRCEATTWFVDGKPSNPSQVHRRIGERWREGKYRTQAKETK